MNNAANGKWGLCLLSVCSNGSNSSVWPRPKKRHSTSVGNSDEARGWGLRCCGLRAWAWTNAPFTAAVQLAKDLNKQASTKYLEQPGLCLSVAVSLFSSPFLPSLSRQFIHFSVSVLRVFYFFSAIVIQLDSVKLNLLSWSRRFVVGFSVLLSAFSGCQNVKLSRAKHVQRIVFFDFKKTQGARHQKKWSKKETKTRTHTFL